MGIARNRKPKETSPDSGSFLVNKSIKRTDRGQGVNSLTFEQLERIIEYMKSSLVKGKPMVYEESGKWFCSLKTTKKQDGSPKYPQVALNVRHFEDDASIHSLGKQLVHLLWWRWENRGVLIDEDRHISHLDARPGCLSVVQESREMNESRKYCHLFEWYKRKTGEDRPRCPHWENPCTGSE